MSETVIKVGINELKTVRITCLSASCGIVTEYAIEKLQSISLAQCRHCGGPLAPSATQPNETVSLASAILLLGKSTMAKIEFVLPQSEQK